MPCHSECAQVQVTKLVLFCHGSEQRNFPGIFSFHPCRCFLPQAHWLQTFCVLKPMTSTTCSRIPTSATPQLRRISSEKSVLMSKSTIRQVKTQSSCTKDNRSLVSRISPFKTCVHMRAMMLLLQEDHLHEVKWHAWYISVRVPQNFVLAVHVEGLNFKCMAPRVRHNKRMIKKACIYI